MKKTVDVDDFIKEFKDYNQENNFSPHGLRLLFGYLENLEEDIGEELELNVIGFCSDFTELTFYDFTKKYSLDVNDEIDWKDIKNEDNDLKKVLQDYLQGKSPLVGFVGNSVQSKSPLVGFTASSVVFRVF